MKLHCLLLKEITKKNDFSATQGHLSTVRSFQLKKNSTIFHSIDDIEDNSKLRRGIPVAHSVYGVPQTINCANYMYFKCLQAVREKSWFVFFILLNTENNEKMKPFLMSCMKTDGKSGKLKNVLSKLVY